MIEGLHKIVSEDETIVAISTPLGHSGIGIIRVSGTLSASIAARSFRARASSTLEHRTAVVGIWMDAAGVTIDEVVVTYFQAPHSYTGEDVLEISAHGNPFVLRKLVNDICAAGARHAGPGEFTLRAVAHGKIDLLQAEAVGEFIQAQTQQQAKIALQQMEGSLSKRIRPLKERLVDLIAHVEAGIDFAEDDVDILPNQTIISHVEPVETELGHLAETFAYGNSIAKGVRLAILGKPNVGKSSLFNRLLFAERAIVTDTPGTTRDVLREQIDFEGIPLSLIDTAGIRETTDAVESIGVSRALETLGDADLALVVLDGSRPIEDDDQRVLCKVHQIPYLMVINKTDLPCVADLESLNGASRIFVSARTGAGLDELRSAMRAKLCSGASDSTNDVILTNSRHHQAVSGALQALTSAHESLIGGVPHEMVLLDLYQALRHLDELTGDVVGDDILDRIFSTFCVGK